MAEGSNSPSTFSYQNSIWKLFPRFYSFWKFSRPHTIIGTTCSVLGIYLIAISPQFNLETSLTLLNQNWVNLVLTWLACICGNIYIVGLNQLEDIEIDVINKPHLPLASGEYSPFQAKIIVGLTGIFAIILSALQGLFLLGMVVTSLVIGTAYSLPPIRLKRFPFWAAVCIFGVRGIVVNLGLFFHWSWIFAGKPPEFMPTVTTPLVVLTLFILVFTFAIAIFKDIPDSEGDRQYNITTFTLKLGAKTVFNLALGVLTFCYLGMIAASFILQSSTNAIFLVLSHFVIFCLMIWRSQKVDLKEKASIASFYQFIWKLFFLEYLLFPFSCLLG